MAAPFVQPIGRVWPLPECSHAIYWLIHALGAISVGWAVPCGFVPHGTVFEDIGLETTGGELPWFRLATFSSPAAAVDRFSLLSQAAVTGFRSGHLKQTAELGS